VPTEGSHLVGRADWVNQYPGVNRDFPIFEASWTYAHTIKPKYSVITRVAGGTTVNQMSLYNTFKASGLFDMSALSRQQLIGNNYYFGGAYLLRSLSGEGISMFRKFYGLIGYEAGNSWYPGRTPTPRQDGLFGIMGATQLGVFFFGGSCRA
jgi:hypothetical protein